MMKKNSNNFINKYLPWILLSLIVLLAIFFRFYKLNSLPPGLFPDEAANGLDVFRILQNHDYRIVYNTNGPREALFFYMQAIFVALIGNTTLALRIAPALMGVVSVIVIYFATKAWFNRRTALVTAFFFAVNPWIVTIQRDGFRASLVPLYLGLLMWFAAKAYKTSKTTYYVLAAISLGLGFYTYTSFYMIILAIALAFIYMLVYRRDWLKNNWKKLAISLAVVGVVVAPLVFTNIKNGKSSTSRAADVSFLNKELNNGKPIQTLLSGTAKTLLQYNYAGDENNRHNFEGKPLLNMFVGLMFILGVVVCFFNLKKPRYAMVLIIFGSMLLGSILTASALPHALRSIGTAVPVFMLAGVGVNYLLYTWYKTFPVNNLARTTGLTIVCILMALTLIQSYRQYFIAWAEDSKTYQAYNEGTSAIAKYILANNSNDIKNVVVINEYESMPIKYLTHDKAEYSILDNNQLRNIPIEGNIKENIFVPNENDYNMQLEILRAKFPNGKVINIKSDFSGELLFSVFEVRQ
jgi:4-amino-4-deoxy-L-arabinose transferase-like glycosyltransferase